MLCKPVYYQIFVNVTNSNRRRGASCACGGVLDPTANKPAKEAKYIKFKTFSTNKRGHGREGRRDYAISDDVEWIKEGFPLWKSIKTIGMVEATREIGGKKNTERRYFVSSLEADAEKFAHTVGGHWGIENTLQYALDVAYREDACRIARIKDGYSPQNMNLIKK